MKNPETVFQELGDLYEFNREISKFRFIESGNKGTATDMPPAAEIPDTGTATDTPHKAPRKT